jgi:hypothetical protein
MKCVIWMRSANVGTGRVGVQFGISSNAALTIHWTRTEIVNVFEQTGMYQSTFLLPIWPNQQRFW